MSGMVPLKSDPSDVRARNIKAVFRLLFPAEQMSRAALGRKVGLSRMAISEIVGEMVENRVLREVGMDTRTGRGKRSMVLAIDPDGLRVVSLDLTRPFVVRGALADLCGRIVDHAEIPYDMDGGMSVDIVERLCAKLLGMTDLPVIGIGVAVPGIVDGDGAVARSIGLGWTAVPLKAAIERRFGIPTVIGNDTNMALLAECAFGDCSGYSMLVKIGQGVGAAVCVDGNIVMGRHHAAGEIGHVVVDPTGPQCVCGKRGCLETLLSVPTLHRRIEEEPESRTAILAEAGQRLGRALTMTVAMLDLRDVSVYGPPDIVGEAFVGAMREELETGMAADYRTLPALHRCQQGDDLILRGQAVEVIGLLVNRIHTPGPVAGVARDDDAETAPDTNQRRQ